MVADRGWTYGAEHEWGDWYPGHLPDGYGLDRRDITMVNSNGIAVDPKGLLYPYGGEINTPPTDDPDGLGQQVTDLRAVLTDPAPVANYRSNLHIHVRVPGLLNDLAALKRLAAYNARWLPEVLPVIEPIPEPTRTQYPDEEEYLGARRRWRRRRVSHHTTIPEYRTIVQQRTTTVEQFFAAEVPVGAGGRPAWTLQPRAAVNLRQLRETNTIEFRHFPGTLDPALVANAGRWCQYYLRLALFAPDQSPVDRLTLPTFPEYCHWQECRYRLTYAGVPAKVRRQNIERLLAQGVPS